MKLLLALLIVIISIPAYAESKTYNIDPLHTSVQWQIEHFGFSTVSGKFPYIKGQVEFDPNNIKNDSVKLTIPIKHLSTGISQLDKNLLSDDFFDVKKYPVATFVSTDIINISKNKKDFDLKGNLTLHGVKKNVILHVKFNGSGLNFEKKQTIGFSATTLLDREEFGISKYSNELGKDIELNIQLEANLEK